MLVWRQPRWTYTKVIFLMARYLPIPGVFLLLRSESGVRRVGDISTLGTPRSGLR
jgi:hypothetical protein